MDSPYSVKLSGPGLELTKAVDQHVALRVLEVVMGDVNTVPTRPGGLQPGREDIRPETTIGEFLAGLTLRNNQDRIAGIALYLRDHLGEIRVPRDDFPIWFQRAGEPAPKNPIRDLNRTVAKKLIAEDHERPGEFFITSTGEKRVNGGAEPEQARKRRRSPSEASNSSIEPNGGGKAQQKRSTTASGQGPTDWLRKLIEADFFSTFRTASETVDELARRGSHLKDSDLTRPLQVFTQNDDLERVKKLPDGKKREVWHYKVP